MEWVTRDPVLMLVAVSDRLLRYLCVSWVSGGSGTECYVSFTPLHESNFNGTCLSVTLQPPFLSGSDPRRAYAHCMLRVTSAVAGPLISGRGERKFNVIYLIIPI